MARGNSTIAVLCQAPRLLITATNTKGKFLNAIAVVCVVSVFHYAIAIVIAVFVLVMPLVYFIVQIFVPLPTKLLDSVTGYYSSRYRNIGERIRLEFNGRLRLHLVLRDHVISNLRLKLRVGIS